MEWQDTSEPSWYGISEHHFLLKKKKKKIENWSNKKKIKGNFCSEDLKEKKNPFQGSF